MGADHILALLNHPAFDGADYLEPFVGYAHVLRRVERKKSYQASDCNRLLIALLQGVQRGQRFPRISKPQYETLRNANGDATFERAVAAFAYSFKGGEWRGYFGTRRGRAYPDEHKRYYEKLHTNPIFQRTRLKCIDYHRLQPRGKLIYCDPPYANTTGYNNGAVFDSVEFWECMRKWSRDNVVFVSEYRAPSDFACVAAAWKRNHLSADGKSDWRRERVFVHKSLLPFMRAHLKMQAPCATGR